LLLAPFIESELTPNADEGEVVLPLLPRVKHGGEKFSREALRPP